MIAASATVWLPDDVVLAVASFAGRPAFGRLGSTCRALRKALISDSSCTALEFEADLRQKPQICTESFDFPRFGQQLPRLAQLDCCAPPNASWVLLHLPSHLVEMPSIAPRALRAAFASICKLARLSFWVDAQHFGGTGQGGGGVHTDAGTNTNTETGTRARTDSTAGLAGRVLRRLHRCCRRRGCNACPRNNPAPPARNVENGPGSWHSGRSASTQDCPRVALQHIVIGLWQRRVKLGAAAAATGDGDGGDCAGHGDHGDTVVSAACLWCMPVTAASPAPVGAFAHGDIRLASRVCTRCQVQVTPPGADAAAALRELVASSCALARATGRGGHVIVFRGGCGGGTAGAGTRARAGAGAGASSPARNHEGATVGLRDVLSRAPEAAVASAMAIEQAALRGAAERGCSSAPPGVEQQPLSAFRFSEVLMTDISGDAAAMCMLMRGAELRAHLGLTGAQYEAATHGPSAAPLAPGDMQWRPLYMRSQHAAGDDGAGSAEDDFDDGADTGMGTATPQARGARPPPVCQRTLRFIVLDNDAEHGALMQPIHELAVRFAELRGRYRRHLDHSSGVACWPLDPLSCAAALVRDAVYGLQDRVAGAAARPRPN